MSKETKFRRELEEFFYFIIWDSISQIIIESAGNIEQLKIKSLQNDLCSLFIDSVIQHQSHTQFKSNFASIIKSSGFLSELDGRIYCRNTILVQATAIQYLHT